MIIHVIRKRTHQAQVLTAHIRDKLPDMKARLNTRTPDRCFH
jgi:hypothetical protein